MSRKEELLESTFILFANNGYNLKISDVTETVGIKKQSIYNYFSSKDELIQTMIINKVNEYYDFVFDFFDHLEGASLKEIIRRFVTKVFEYYQEPLNLMCRRWLAIYLRMEHMTSIRSLISRKESDITNKLMNIFKEHNGKDEDLLYLQVLIRGLLDGNWLTEINSPIEDTIEIIMNCYFKKNHV